MAGTYVGYKYLYKDHRDIQAETASLNLEAHQLYDLFQTPQTDLALNNTIVVKGVVEEIESTSITLKGGVRCIFELLPEDLEIGVIVEIKGRCLGYNDLFELVELDQCQKLN